MCGIGGCVVPRGQEPPRQRLERLVGVLDHRGPDGHGIFVSDNVGLVNTRLAIVDPTPRGKQPMVHPGGNWALTYNGEIFNHLELRNELSRRAFRGGSDTETLLWALDCWGEQAIPRLNGLFAFAALDVAQRRLLLVRDRFGVKPLYYAVRDGSLWFASEIGALLAAGIKAKPRRERVARALSYGWAGGRESLIDGIDRVMPGTTLSMDLETLECSTSRWYSPADVVDPSRQADLAGRTRKELRALLEHELREAVARRLMADVPIGTMCSGGIDSGLSTAFARERHPDIIAFSASISGASTFDEGPWASRVARALDVQLETVDVTPQSWRAGLVETVRHYEYPLPNESAVSIAQIAATARRQGVKALLAGEGADELFGGYWHVHRSAYVDYLRPWPRFLYALDSVRRLGARGTISELRRRGLRAESPVSEDVADESGAEFEQAISTLAQMEYQNHPRASQRLEAELLSDLSTIMPMLLNRMDKNGMQNAVEVRLPFLDPAVVALVLNLPLEARVGPMPKGILRDLARSHLPLSVALRPKQYGLLGDAHEWIEAAAQPEFLRNGLLRDVLEIDSCQWYELVGALPGRRAVQFWTGEIWCRLMIDGAASATVEAELWADGDA